MEISYATSNRKKFEEALHVFDGAAGVTIKHTPLHLEEMQGHVEDIAFHKLREAASKLAGPIIIDDISLHAAALKGLPGPYVRSFLETLGEEGLADLILRYEDHACTVRCTIGFLEGKEAQPLLFEGIIEAQIVPPRGSLTRHGAISWNCIVVPNGYNTTFAELSLADIAKISPRGKALEKLRDYLMQRVTR